MRALCTRCAISDRIELPLAASAMARLVPSRPVPMIETFDFSFLFAAGIGILRASKGAKNLILLARSYVRPHNQVAEPEHHRLRVWI